MMSQPNRYLNVGFDLQRRAVCVRTLIFCPKPALGAKQGFSSDTNPFISRGFRAVGFNEHDSRGMIQARIVKASLFVPSGSFCKTPMRFLALSRAFTDLEMVSLKTEIWLVKTFRLLLPATMFVILFWTVEAPPEWQNSLISSLGTNARHVFFFLGMVVIAGLYKFMGVYERKIFYESHHLKGSLLRRPEE